MCKHNLNYNKLEKVTNNCIPMYDWITARIDWQEQGLTKKQVLNDVVVETITKCIYSGITWHNGYVVNNANKRKLGVNVGNNGGLTIKVCPPKYIKDNNVEEASLYETYNLFFNLSNSLSIDLTKAEVKKLDITHTAKSDHSPIAYYPHLCNQNTFTRWQQDTSLYYRANSKPITKVLYDKVTEVKKKASQEIPEEYKGTPLTRFELKLGSNSIISKVANKSHKLLVDDLFKEEYVVHLDNYWHQEWDSIPKETKIKDVNRKLKPSELVKFINLKALEEYGRVNIEEIINNKAEEFKYSKQEKYRARQMLKLYEENATMSEQIVELDKKFKDMQPKWS